MFVLALGLLCALAGGERLLRPSANNHYSHLAQSWLDGQLEHEGKPKGWCTKELRQAERCRGHRYDDWARVWTLELRDGTTLRGFPCKTRACAERRRQGVEPWLVLGTEHELRELPRREIVARRETWYVSFPPAPALAMLPAVALWGPEGTPDVLITCLLAALIPVVMLGLFDRVRGSVGAVGREHLWAVAAWTLASPAALLGSHGRVWFTAQILGALCLTLYVSMAWRCHRPALAGLALGLAVACRPHLAVAVVFFGAEWWRETGALGEGRGRERARAAVNFAAPVLLVGVALMAHNWARFEDPFEFGHRFLDIRWQQRMQEIGMFSTDYLGRNLRCALSLMPVWDHGPGPAPAFLGGPTAAWSPRVSLHGSSALLGAPWLVMLALPLLPRRWLQGGSRGGSTRATGSGGGEPASSASSASDCPQRWVLLAAAAAVALPSLLYQNSGQIQFSYRFAVDWLPLLLPALILAGGASGTRRRGVFAALVVVGLAWQLHGAWWFDRAPGLLFVTDPMAWPFEAELNAP